MNLFRRGLLRERQRECKGIGLLTVGFTVGMSDCDLPFTWGDTTRTYQVRVVFWSLFSFSKEPSTQAWVPEIRFVAGVRGSIVQTPVFSHHSAHPHPQLCQYSHASGVSS